MGRRGWILGVAVLVAAAVVVTTLLLGHAERPVPVGMPGYMHSGGPLIDDARLLADARKVWRDAPHPPGYNVSALYAGPMGRGRLVLLEDRGRVASVEFGPGRGAGRLAGVSPETRSGQFVATPEGILLGDELPQDWILERIPALFGSSDTPVATRDGAIAGGFLPVPPSSADWGAYVPVDAELRADAVPIILHTGDLPPTQLEVDARDWPALRRALLDPRYAAVTAAALGAAVHGNPGPRTGVLRLVQVVHRPSRSPAGKPMVAVAASTITHTSVGFGTAVRGGLPLGFSLGAARRPDPDARVAEPVLRARVVRGRGVGPWVVAAGRGVARIRYFVGVHSGTRAGSFLLVPDLGGGKPLAVRGLTRDGAALPTSLGG